MRVLLSDKSVLTEQSEFSLEVMATQITVPVLMRVLSTVFKCMPSCAFVLGCRHKCICLCVCAVVLASICVRAGSSWLTGV